MTVYEEIFEVIKQRKADYENGTAQENSYMKRAVEVYGVDPEKAEKIVKDTDRARSRHYKHYSDLKWGVADNYDICMDMGTFTFDGAVRLLADSIEVMNK